MRAVPYIFAGWFVFAIMAAHALRAAEVADLGRDGVDIKVEAEPDTVDQARDFFVTLTFVAPAGRTLRIGDLRDRFSGFRVAEDFAEDPAPAADGRTILVSRWRLVPEPVAEKYRLAPFLVTLLPGEGETNLVEFCTRPVYFAPPPAREAVTGEMEVDPQKDLPPLSWKLVGWCALILAGFALVIAAIWWVVRKIREMVRVHRMSPIERALYELDRLLAKGLPGRGFYKDFYVELTMVVRRYVQRKYGIKAPNLTTQEFFEELGKSNLQTIAQAENLRRFLESSDLVKFAGVEATPEMADAATSSARNYLAFDSSVITSAK